MDFPDFKDPHLVWDSEHHVVVGVTDSRGDAQRAMDWLTKMMKRPHHIQPVNEIPPEYEEMKL